MPYETVVYFDSVYFLESLRQDELPTGRDLFENVVAPWAAQGGGIAAAHVQVHTGAALLAQLDLIAAHTRQKRHAPVLQIDAHGSEDGLKLSSHEIVPWETLAEPLARINHACQFNLVVVSSACFGWYMVKALNPTGRAPAWGIIGPNDEIEAGDLYDASKAFYETLFSTTDLRAAVGAMNPGKPYEHWTIRIQTAELLFCRLFRIYMTEIATAEKDNERATRILARIAPQLGLDDRRKESARARLKEFLRNHRFWFDRLRRTFLMLDDFPNNSKRFPLTFDECTKGTA